MENEVRSCELERLEERFHTRVRHIYGRICVIIRIFRNKKNELKIRPCNRYVEKCTKKRGVGWGEET